MIWTLPFKILSGADASADAIRCLVGSGGTTVPAVKLIGLNIRGFDRLMPDVPPTGGPGDVNMTVKLFRTIYQTISPPGTVLGPNDCVMEPRGMNGINFVRASVLWLAAGGELTGLSPIFVAGFNARKGFNKVWSVARAFAILQNHPIVNPYEVFYLTITPKKALVEKGLILHGTMTLAA